ncbi:uncharacterized protein KD926_009337 [Aspergillus affinis]|uniref:uncharacterized protein n=1 Tax=Aspergillus affinis TaxID=1070780 RepID=UPI0022FE1CD7|nr:uncharacterized protein KD926_009337 [Aspergillus affinis]KAI9039463.1 hypothetical protein KD926_009337 [Aspergillus affinis]
MDGSVVEGISTSLQTCPPDPQAFMPLGDLPNSPSFSHLHVNDLGLTPPPGSPLQQPTDVLQKFPQGENHGSSDGNPMRSKDGLVIQDGLDQSKGIVHDGLGQKQGHSFATGDTDGSGHVNEKSSTASDIPFSIAEASAIATQDISSEADHNAIDVNTEFYDNLFDSDSVLRELDAVFASRKRSGEDAFPGEFDFWAQPVKKQSVSPTTNEQCTTPDETPSLSSTDSIARLEQGDSYPHTPAGTETAKSPGPFFESLDTLFEDPNFDIPLENPDNFPFNLESPSFFDQPAEEVQPATQSTSHPNTDDNIPKPAENVDVEPGPAQACLSDITKERFSLDPQDIIANTSREVLQRVYKEPEYSSPYPAYGGPLGYFPSAPNAHVRCIEVADDRANYRLSSLKDKVQHLTWERNKYRNAWYEWTTLDQKTGKTKEQLLREENATLKRVSSQHQNRAEQYKKEIVEWKNKMRELGITHNNLLYEINVRRQMPAVTPIPAGYKPPTTRGPPPVTPSASGLLSLVPHAASTPDASAARGHHQQAQPSCATTTLASRPAPRESRPPPVTIDLTEDTTEQSPAPPPELSPEQQRRRIEMLQSMRNKKYGWLNETDPAGHSGLQRLNGGTPPASITHRDHPPHAEPAGPGNGGDTTDDELARAMEEELAQA